jgi:hypothetical protein
MEAPHAKPPLRIAMQQLQHRSLESPQIPFLFAGQLTLPWKQCIAPELLQNLQPYIQLLPESTRKTTSSTLEHNTS